MRSSTETNNQFAKGVLATLAAIVVLSAVIKLIEWVRSHPTPDAIIEFLTRPMISIAEVLFLSLWVLIVWAVVYMLAFGPVMR